MYVCIPCNSLKIVYSTIIIFLIRIVGICKLNIKINFECTQQKVI